MANSTKEDLMLEERTRPGSPPLKRQKLAGNEYQIDQRSLQKHGNGVLQQLQTSRESPTAPHLTPIHTSSIKGAQMNEDYVPNALEVEKSSTGEPPTGGRRSSRIAAQPAAHPANTDYTAATSEEREKWRGFCKIESEPMILNALLHDLSGDHVELREVYAMDEDVIESLGRKIHGFMFLYQVYEADNPVHELGVEDDGDTEGELPWFANQIASNSCATVALMNLLANRQPSIYSWTTDPNSLADAIIIETATQSSFTRGEAIRHRCGAVHNKYARKMEILDVDLALDNSWEDTNKKSSAGNKGKNARSAGKTPRRRKSKASETIHHYVAYIWDGRDAIWMLDGLQHHPAKVASYTAGDQDPAEDWWRAVLPVIQQCMADFADGGIGANLLALVESRSIESIATLALRGAEILHAEEMLAKEWIFADSSTHYEYFNPGEWWLYTQNTPSLQHFASVMHRRNTPYVPSVRVVGVDETLGVTQRCWNWAVAMTTSQTVSETMHRETLRSAERELLQQNQQRPSLGALRLWCFAEQARLKKDIESEHERRRGERLQAEAKQIDNGPFLHAWLGMLAESQAWKDAVLAKGSL